jgi:hypothetical protein
MRVPWKKLVCLTALACAAGLSRAQGLEGLPEVLLREVRDPAALPQGRYVLVQAWQAEAAPHKTGRVVDDPEAEGGQALEASPDTEAPDTMLFGPYLEVEPGNYVVFFRAKVLEEPEDDRLATLDACVAYGQEILAAQDLTAEDLPVGRYVQIPLGFRYAGGKLECRVTWSGAAALRLDGVSLVRLHGAEPPAPARVPQPTPTGLPKDLPYYSEPRPFPEIFPRSAPPARQLWVCDLRNQRPDLRLLGFVLQGLINRSQPRVYCLLHPTDQLWLDHLKARGWVEGTQPTSVLELLARFRDLVQGMVITDPHLPASKNVATMLAAIKNAVVVSPRLAKQLDLPVLDDLRGRWATNVQAYRWAFDNLWPRLNHHVLACSWPDHLGLRDYLVAHKVFIFWLSGPLDGARSGARPQEEVQLMEELFARMSVNLPIMSYPWAGKDVGIGEGPGVSLFAEFGKYLVGSIDCTNLTVHSSIQVEALRQKPAPPPPPLEDDKVYYSFIISDGDNLPVLTASNFPQLWQDKTRGQLPLGWTLSPAARVLIPDIVDYYYATATPNDYFLSAVSGVGYTYPDLYAQRYRAPDRARIFDEFLQQTAQYMRGTDLKCAWIMGATRPEIISRFAERIPFLEALFLDYGRRVGSATDATYPTARNVPVFHAVTGWRLEAPREERIAHMVREIQQMTPPRRPAFLHAFVLNWATDLPMLVEVARRLGPDYVPVRPDHLAELWRREMQRRQVFVRLPASVACLEGQPLLLTGTLHNVSAQPLRLRLRVLEGLAEARVTGPAAKLAPAQQATFAIKGKPVGERLRLALTGSLPAQQIEVNFHLVPRAALAFPVPAQANLIATQYLEAENLSHHSGALAADPEASGGQMWLAKPAADQPGHIVFGPYQPLPAGKYLALFRLQRLGEGEGILCVLDTCVGGGQPQTAERQVKAADLPLRQWRWVPLFFDHPGGQYETRVFWPGAVPLAVDAIGLWQVR